MNRGTFFLKCCRVSQPCALRKADSSHDHLLIWNEILYWGIIRLPLHSLSVRLCSNSLRVYMPWSLPGTVELTCPSGISMLPDLFFFFCFLQYQPCSSPRMCSQWRKRRVHYTSPFSALATWAMSPPWGATPRARQQKSWRTLQRGEMQTSPASLSWKGRRWAEPGLQGEWRTTERSRADLLLDSVLLEGADSGCQNWFCRCLRSQILLVLEIWLVSEWRSLFHNKTG